MANESAAASNDVSTVPLQPLVFQCRACRMVVGDSVNFDCSVRSLACVALTGRDCGENIDVKRQIFVRPSLASQPRPPPRLQKKKKKKLLVSHQARRASPSTRTLRPRSSPATQQDPVAEPPPLTAMKTTRALRRRPPSPLSPSRARAAAPRWARDSGSAGCPLACAG